MLEITLIGNVGASASIRESKDGKKFISFDVCVDQSYTDKEGIKHERNTWVSCTKPLYNDSSKLVSYLNKGTKVLVRGVPSAKPYNDKDNVVRASLNCSIEHLELLGGPKVEHSVNKERKEEELPY